MIAEVRAELAEIVRHEEIRHAEIKEEFQKQRQEIERVGRQTYLLGQSQRGLSEEVGGLPVVWRRFVDDAEARATNRAAAKDPRGEVLAGLMPLKDTFLAARRQAYEMGVWREVFAALESRLDQSLQDLGAQALAEPGKPFDARLHSAVLAAHSEWPAGTVLAVLRQGYALSGTLQRLAEVQVSLGPAPAAREHGETPAQPEPAPDSGEENGSGGAVPDARPAPSVTAPAGASGPWELNAGAPDHEEDWASAQPAPPATAPAGASDPRELNAGAPDHEEDWAPDAQPAPPATAPAGASDPLAENEHAWDDREDAADADRWD